MTKSFIDLMKIIKIVPDVKIYIVPKVSTYTYAHFYTISILQRWYIPFTEVFLN